MLRLGSSPPQSRQMDIDDIFFCRLKLLIIMAKALLGGCPMGDHRRRAVLENCQHVESESIEMGNLSSDRFRRETSSGHFEFDHVFYQRVKLLAVMMKAAARGFPMGDLRQNALKENLAIISQSLTPDGQMEDMPFLRM